MTTLLFLSMFAVNAYPVIPYSNAVKQISIIIFLVTFIIPALSISFLLLTKSISSLRLEDRRERIIPFSFITIFYGVASWMFVSRLGIAGHINLILITITALILVLTIITIFWKISAHATAIGGVLGFFTAIYLNDPQPKVLNAIAILVVAAGVIMSSRLKLNAHTPPQLYAGLIMGFVISFFSLTMFS